MFTGVLALVGALAPGAAAGAAPDAQVDAHEGQGRTGSRSDPSRRAMHPPIGDRRLDT
jgi:hypothetical protein